MSDVFSPAITAGEHLARFVRVLLGDMPPEDSLEPQAQVQTPLGTFADFRNQLAALGVNSETIGIIEAKGNPLFSAEIRLTSIREGKRSLFPVAFTIERSAEKIKRVRAYGKFPGGTSAGDYGLTEAMPLPRDIEKFQAACRDASVGSLVQLFGPQGAITDSRGRIFGPVAGTDIRDFFPSWFRDGGVDLVFHTVIVGSESVAAEYTRKDLGGDKKTHRGIAFFHRKNGLNAARFYEN